MTAGWTAIAIDPADGVAVALRDLSAGEEVIVRVGGKVEPVFIESIGELPGAIAAIVQPGDVVLTMGAGSIGGVPAQLRALQQAAG